MKYRIKKVSYNGLTQYYPQYRLFFIWFHFNYYTEFGDFDVVFNNFKEAKRFIEKQEEKEKIEYINF